MRLKLLSIIASGIIFAGFAGNASADVSGLQIRFGGGCLTSDVDGSCTIKTLASGTDLRSETVELYSAAKRGEPLHRVSYRLRPLTEHGDAIFRLKNIPGGCYQVRTGPNGNEKPDAHSRVLCEQ